jgi:2-methylcitrate dehydratase PrpD
MPSPAMQSLMEQITVVADDTLLQHYPGEWPARVSLVTSRGRQEILVRHVLGDPARPMDYAGLKTKFDRLVGSVLGEAPGPLWRTAIEALHLARRPTDLLQQLDQIIEQVSAD